MRVDLQFNEAVNGATKVTSLPIPDTRIYQKGYLWDM